MARGDDAEDRAQYGIWPVSDSADYLDRPLPTYMTDAGIDRPGFPDTFHSYGFADLVQTWFWCAEDRRRVGNLDAAPTQYHGLAVTLDVDLNRRPAVARSQVPEWMRGEREEQLRAAPDHRARPDRLSKLERDCLFDVLHTARRTFDDGRSPFHEYLEAPMALHALFRRWRDQPASEGRKALALDVVEAVWGEDPTRTIRPQLIPLYGPLPDVDAAAGGVRTDHLERVAAALGIGHWGRNVLPSEDGGPFDVLQLNGTDVALSVAGRWLTVGIARTSWAERHPGPVYDVRARIQADLDDDLWSGVLGRVVTDVARRRRASYRRCTDCRERMEPEHLTWIAHKPVCHSCAARNHGVRF